MLARVAATVRGDRRLQVGIAALAVAGGAFAWWAISPFFIRTTVVETTREATITVVSATRAPLTGIIPSATSDAAALPPVARLIARGELQRLDDLHQGKGPVILFELDGKRFLRFENVAILNGPNLQVYLGRGTGGLYDGDRDLHLGALKAPNGTFIYEIPPGTDLEKYGSVIVWCRTFRVVFTYADLGP